MAMLNNQRVYVYIYIYICMKGHCGKANAINIINLQVWRVSYTAYFHGYTAYQRVFIQPYFHSSIDGVFEDFAEFGHQIGSTILLIQSSKLAQADGKLLFFDPSTVIWQSSNLFATLHIPGPMLFPFVYGKWLCFMDQLSPDPTTIDVLGYSWWKEGSMIPLNGIQVGPSFQKDIGTVTTTTATTVTYCN